MNKLIVLSKILNKRSFVLLSIPTIGYKYWSQTKVQSTKPLVTRLGVQRVRDLSLRRAHLNGHKSTDEIINEMRKCFVQIKDFTYDWEEYQCELAIGSGMFIDLDGYILTNSHVTEESKEIEVIPFTPTTKDSVTYIRDDLDIHWLGSLVYAEPDIDLALYRTHERPSNVSVVTFNESLEVGEDVIALGNPDIDFSVCEGIITQLHRQSITWSLGTTLYYKNFVDLYHGFVSSTTKLWVGYSGGPLINSKGQVVAVNFASTGDLKESYSTSTAEAKDFIKRALIFEVKDREMRHSLNKTNILGITAHDFNMDTKDYIQGLPSMANFASHLDDEDQGVLVCCSLTPYSYSEYSEDIFREFDSLENWDIIIKVNEMNIKDVDDLKDAIKHLDNNEMKVSVWRDTLLQHLTIRPQTIHFSLI